MIKNDAMIVFLRLDFLSVSASQALITDCLVIPSLLASRSSESTIHDANRQVLRLVICFCGSIQHHPRWSVFGRHVRAEQPLHLKKSVGVLH